MRIVTTTVPNIDKPLLDLLVSLYFGVDDRAWFYEERGNYRRNFRPGILGTLERRGLVDIVDRTKQNILSLGVGRVKFGVTDTGEEIIKLVFLSDPNRIIEASRAYLQWVPMTVTDVLRYVTNVLRADMSRLPELLASEAPLISETASVLLDWLQEGQVMELADMTSSNLVG